MLFESIKHILGNYRRHLWAVFFALSLFISTLCIAIDLQPDATASGLPPKANNQAKVVTSIPVAPPVKATASPSVATPTRTIPTPQKCTPAGYSAPTLIDVTAQSAGLTQIIDDPIRYRVYGNTNDQIQTEVDQCAPNLSTSGSAGAEFAGETSSSLSWNYDWLEDSSDQCRVTNARVGLHIGMILPQWQATPYAQIGLANAWQNFASNLLIHENGHLAIDQQYANQMLSDMQSFPLTPCASLNSAIQDKMQADIVAQNAANYSYDVSTDHGATQGAILP